jgi:hypothetical protein
MATIFVAQCFRLISTTPNAIDGWMMSENGPQNFAWSMNFPCASLETSSKRRSMLSADWLDQRNVRPAASSDFR